MANKLQVPAIHLNGSGKQNLLELNRNAANALHQAADALAEASPHRRDYYILEDEAWERAVAQHLNRMQRLQDIIRDLDAIGTEIFNQ